MKQCEGFAIGNIRLTNSQNAGFQTRIFHKVSHKSFKDTTTFSIHEIFFTFHAPENYLSIKCGSYCLFFSKKLPKYERLCLIL